MKMVIGADLPDDFDVEHDNLAAAAATLMGQTLLPLFAENMPDELAKANVAGIILELAYMFDEGEIEIGGKTFRPRLAFIDESGVPLSGIAELDTLHDLAGAPFDIDPEAKISFQEVEFEEAS